MPSPYNTMDDRPLGQSGHTKPATLRDQDIWSESDSLNATQSSIASLGTKKALWAYLVLCFSVGQSSTYW